MSEYIEREAVMDALLHEQYGYLCEDAIKAIPAADVRPVVRGKFVFDENDYLHCSECDCSFAALMYTVGSKLFVRPNFCPNCGARMGGDGA